MPADIATAMESGSAASAQTNAAQQVIASLTSTTNQGAGYAQDYASQGVNALQNYTNAANQNAFNVAGSNIGQIQSGVGQATGYFSPIWAPALLQRTNTRI